MEIATQNVSRGINRARRDRRRGFTFAREQTEMAASDGFDYRNIAVSIIERDGNIAIITAAIVLRRSFRVAGTTRAVVFEFGAAGNCYRDLIRIRAYRAVASKRFVIKRVSRGVGMIEIVRSLGRKFARNFRRCDRRTLVFFIRHRYDRLSLSLSICRRIMRSTRYKVKENEC